MTECEKMIRDGFINPDFLKEEVRCEYKVPAEIKKVWAIELGLYQQLKTVCDKHHLRYWAAFGTLLGAIRHNGFIPWDDDFDIWMPRDDYEQLLRLGESEFHPPFFLQTTLNDNDYYSAFARLRNSNTTGILNVSRNNRCNNGIYIDIYPLDGAPNSERARKRRQLINHTRNVFAHAYVYNINPNPLARIAHTVLRCPLVPYDYKKVYKKVNQYAQKYPFGSTGYVGNMTFPGGFHNDLYYDKEMFADSVMHPFEFLELPVPVGYHELLTRSYGDYMQFPPVEMRGKWHEFTFAPDIPYTEYQGDANEKTTK